MDSIVEAEESFLQRIWKTYKIPLVLGTLSLAAIIFSGILLIKSIRTTSPITFEEASAKPTTEARGKISVDIEGAVNSPGVYYLEGSARVEEAIKAAGGFSREADQVLIAKTLNRAQILVDGTKIFIPKIGDSPANTNIIVRHLEQTNPVGGLVNVNSASLSELDSLPSVGPATAQKIISGRPYQTLEELVTKKAISQSLFFKLKDSLSL